MIENLLIVSAVIWGAHCLFTTPYIFSGVGAMMERFLGTRICKPLFLCPPCMASVYGILFVILTDYYSWQYELVFIIALCGINYVIKLIVYPEYEETSP